MSKLIESTTIIFLLGLLMLIGRYFITGNSGYYFLLWNLLLAIVPLIISIINEKYRKLTILLLPIWILFYPNAPYIVTDYIHIPKEHALFLQSYNFILVTIFSFLGLLFGFLALYKQNTIMFPKRQDKQNMFTLFMSLASAFGVYLGRFLRFNSWDIVKPHILLNMAHETIEDYFYVGIFTIALIFLINYLGYTEFKKFMDADNRNTIKNKY
ncbi:MAG: DUF1361 domain-containing protein [Romboutsia sp.]|nr:DUF1361 domain-containing protein [Romboutsia sp.]